MKKRTLLALSVPSALVVAYAGLPASAGLGSGVGNIPQGTQPDSAYAKSFKTHGVTDVDATTQKISCYRPEVPFTTVGSNPMGYPDAYTGMTPCNGVSTTGENTGSAAENPSTGGIYPNQQGSASGYPAASPMRVNDHSESDLRVDPRNPKHVIASSKWFASAEGYNHVLGFYESFDGGATWPVQGHIPGYEGFSDNTDPVGAFDGDSNYYEFVLPYQFAYANASGSKLYQKSKLPNAAMPPEATSVAVRPANAGTDPTRWITTHNGNPDFVYQDFNQGQEPDKQWIAIDTHKFLPNGKPNPKYDTIYAMFVNFSFDGLMSKAYVSTAKARPDGTHTDWSPLQRLPSLNSSASDTYLLPHVDPSGTVWTSITNFPSRQSRSTASLAVDFSTDGGTTWQGPLPVTKGQKVTIAPLVYANTTFTDGIENTFTVGTHQVNGHYPLYMAWEDDSAGNGNIVLSGSFDGGLSWSDPIQVNDNASAVDEFQPNVAAAADGTVSVNFYDRRLACQKSNDADAARSGIALDTANPNYSGALPPYGATNYCVNTSIQFYSSTLQPIGHNIRLSGHTWDPQLNAPWRYGSSTFTGKDTFIGDYFGNDFSAKTSLTTSVSTFDDGNNPHHYQQQVVATIQIP